MATKPEEILMNPGFHEALSPEGRNVLSDYMKGFQLSDEDIDLLEEVAGEAVEHAEWQTALAESTVELEHRLGEELTGAEYRALVDLVSQSSDPPDLASAYGEVYGNQADEYGHRNVRDSQIRQERIAEIAEDAFERGANEDAEREADPDPLDEPIDFDRTDAMAKTRAIEQAVTERNEADQAEEAEEINA